MEATDAHTTFCGHVHRPALYSLGDTGKLTNFRQMLTTPELYKAQINVWTKKDVLEHFGAPREPVEYYPRLKLETWSYRFLHEDIWYSMFNFMFDDAGVLRRSLVTPDPLRDRPERN